MRKRRKTNKNRRADPVEKVAKSISRRQKEDKKLRKEKNSVFQNINEDEQKLFRVLSAKNFDVQGVPELNDNFKQMGRNKNPGKIALLLREWFKRSKTTESVIVRANSWGSFSLDSSGTPTQVGSTYSCSDQRN